MTLETMAPATFSFYAPRFEVQINNKTLTADISKAIMDVTIDEKMDEGASFHFTVNDEFDLKTQKFKWLDHPLFEVGNTVSIKIGYGSDLQDMVLGKISSLEPSFFQGNCRRSPSRDRTSPTISSSARPRKNPSSSALTVRLPGKSPRRRNLQAVVDDTGTFESFIQKNNNETYYAFLESLATKVGYTFTVDRRTMYFIKPKDDKKEIFTLELGKDIISFRPRMNATNVVTEVEVRGHNPNDPNTPIIGRAKAGSERGQEPAKTTASTFVADRTGPVKRVITCVIVNSTEHANAVALSELNQRSDGFIEGASKLSASRKFGRESR